MDKEVEDKALGAEVGDTFLEEVAQDTEVGGRALDMEEEDMAWGTEAGDTVSAAQVQAVDKASHTPQVCSALLALMEAVQTWVDSSEGNPDLQRFHSW